MFAVIITTYQRSDGKTPFYLKRALDSVFAQTFRDFKIFLVGDHYENHSEFEHIVAPYRGNKLFVINLDKAVERSKYKDRYTLWCCGGITAANKGLDSALEQKITNICHLDHDDYWKENHLFLINGVISKYGADWICTKSIYGSAGGMLPDFQSEEVIVPFIPIGGGVINSATYYNYKTIPLRYRNVFEEDGIAIPSDSDLWNRVNKYIEENNLKSFLINRTTCHHEEEGYLIS
jgi:glycosyltransferase involved in cell wall biosynthesis